MEEQIKQLWSVLQGSDGLFTQVAAIRGFLAFTVPLVNSKLQAWFTKLLVESPSLHNSIVGNKFYRAVALTLRMTIDIKLPNENSIIVHEAKEEEKRQTEFITKPETKD